MFLISGTDEGQKNTPPVQAWVSAFSLRLFELKPKQQKVSITADNFGKIFIKN